jgi:hypothetical protein
VEVGADWNRAERPDHSPGGFSPWAGAASMGVRPEARLLFTLACVHKRHHGTKLFCHCSARSKRRMQWLVGASGAGYLMQILMLDNKNEIATTDVGVLNGLCSYSFPRS